MTTIQKMMKQVAEQEKKQQQQKEQKEQQAMKQQENQKETIENLHLYIPYAFDNVSKEQMRENLSGFGKIKVIDFVAKLDKKNMNYNSAYIYFEHWYPTPENKKIQAQIRQYTKSQNKLHSFKLNYNGNLHWIILENTSPSPHPKQDRKAMIDLKPTQEPALAQESAKQVSIDEINTDKYQSTLSLSQTKIKFDEMMMKEEKKIEKTTVDDGRLSMHQRRIEEMMRINEHEKQFQKDQEYQEQEDQEQEYQEQYPSQITQAFYYYYYMMSIEQREMDQITEAIDEEDAWSQHLEQIEQECDFCEDVAGEQEEEEEKEKEQEKETFNVDYEYVQMLELELAKIRANM
jgi:hypothetical protein